MIARLLVLWLFYLLVTGQLARFIAYATTDAQSADTGQQPANALPGLPGLPQN